jgi:deoxyribonuclease-4
MLERVNAFHLNDCQLPCGAHRDRHAVPGGGTIGMGVISVASHPAFASLPGVIELSVEEGRRGLAFLREHGGLQQ